LAASAGVVASVAAADTAAAAPANFKILLLIKSLQNQRGIRLTGGKGLPSERCCDSFGYFNAVVPEARKNLRGGQAEAAAR
jgi:hypothetical protein